MIIDTHVHLKKRDLKKPKEIERMVSQGAVDMVWLLSGNAVALDLATDEEVFQLSRDYPGFFIPFGWLDFEREPEMVDELHERGFVGLKTEWAHKPFDHPDFMPFYQKAEKHNMPIVFHASATHGTPDFRGKRHPDSVLTRNQHVMAIDTIAHAFPDLIMIAAHMGRPWCEEAISIASGCPNVYLDVQGTSRPPRIRYLQVAYECPMPGGGYVGDDKLLMGSDHFVTPYLASPKTAWEATLRAVVPRATSEMVEKLTGGNALKIMKQAGIAVRPKANT